MKGVYLLLLLMLLFFSCQKYEKQTIFIDYKNKILEIKQPSDFVFDSISIGDEIGIKYNSSLTNKVNGSSFINLQQNNIPNYEMYTNTIENLSCKSEISIVLRRKDYESKITFDEASNFKYNRNVITLNMIYRYCSREKDTFYSVPFWR